MGGQGSSRAAACVYVVRHAEATWSADDSAGLTADGHRAAVQVAEALAKVECAAIYSSPYRRAIETIQPFAQRRALPIQEIGDLRERRLADESIPDFRAALRLTWEDFSFAHAGGESSAEAQQRMVRVFDSLCARHPQEGFVLCTHGNVMALLLRWFDSSVDFEFWSKLSWPDVYELRLEASGTTFTRRWSA